MRNATRNKRTLTTLGLALAVTTAVSAQDFAFKNEINGRQALMNLYSFNLGLLGAMAKGEMPYDAKIAGSAANNLLLATSMDQSAMWPEGSGADGEGLDGKTRAKPEIWSSYPAITDKHRDLAEAAEQIATQAGSGLDALRASIGAVGDGCKGCHEEFRVPKDQ